MTGLFSSVDVGVDLERIVTACGKAQREVIFGARIAVTHAAEEGLAESKARRRYKDHSGSRGLTARAVARFISSSDSGATAEIKWPSQYASYVEEGTPPHLIEARRKPNLVFWWAAANRLFIGKRVNHPGTKGYGFAGDAYLKAERVLEREVGELAARMEVCFR